MKSIVYVAFSVLLCLVVAIEPIHTPFYHDSLDFSNWDFVLRECVDTDDELEGITLNTFDFVKLSTNETVNNFYLAFTQQVENADTANFNQSEFLAFWINVYNYLSVRTVLDHPCQKDLFGDCRPLLSITQVGQQQPSLLETVWTMPQLQMKNLNNRALSLDNIEVDRLRNPAAYPNKTEDVRIHGCIVCASISCPNIRPSAYTVANIDTEMSDNTRNFLMNSQKGSKYDGGSSVQLSETFRWFDTDFDTSRPATFGSVKNFLIQFAPAATAHFLQSSTDTAPYTWFSYNWHINGNVGQLCKANRACFPWWALLCLLLGLLISVIITAVCVRRKLRHPQYIHIPGSPVN